MNKSALHRHGPSPSQLLAESLDSLRLLGRQSMLALLGIVVGSASIIALLNIGRNAADESIRAFNDMGTDILVVSFPHSPQDNRPFPSTLDTDALKEAVPAIAHVAPITIHSARVSFNGQAAEATLVGTSADLASAVGLQIQEGRFLSDFDHRETFVVVGARVARDLGAKGNPLQIGDLLQIENYLFQVIGIAESLPASPLIPVAVDESVILPIEGMRRVLSAPEIGSVIGKVAATADLPATAKVLHNYLIGWLDGREVEVQIPQHLLDGLKRQANMFSYLLAGLGGISLLVGGVGVMNVMLMNVSARRIEIGVRMALGARPRDIRSLFLLEAGTLSVVGALLGALLGLAVAYVFTRVSGWQFTFVPESLLFGCGSSLLIGLFFGLYPAIAASRLQPVQALRNV
ncbi:ABC transporter permease [Methylobacter sp. Wu8]|uniref:ABC transporter permease n=1 Tax=Methylobacter sp. Wu8 TaxID=3118457 RepID=UPI002F321188